MENMVVMLPSLGISHLISMIELGKLILTTDPSLAITILLTPAHYETKSIANYIKTVTSSTTHSITFHTLPTLPHPPDPSDFAFNHIKLYNPIVHDLLQSIQEKSIIKGVILDFFAVDGLEVCKSLNLPTYYLFAGSAFGVGIMLYLKTLHNKFSQSFGDLRVYIEAPGTPPIYSLDMPPSMIDRNSYSYKNRLAISNNMAKAQGIIVNTFADLEPRVMKALADGEYILDGPTPPIYCVGPLIRGNSGANSRDECLLWLDSQPKKSVVVLIFGSLGLFKKDQLIEMAKGLEKSGQRFLWVVRTPPPENKDGHEFEHTEPDLDDLLPEGFIDRNKEKGLVLKNWAPQDEILKHDSVGGFVCHCGWNSVLEAMNAGVALVAWPLYAEQKMNRVHLVEGIKVALPLKMSEDGFVTGDELSKRLRELMEEESGRKLREYVSGISEIAKAAMMEGGSSKVAVVKLLESMKSG